MNTYFIILFIRSIEVKNVKNFKIFNTILHFILTLNQIEDQMIVNNIDRLIPCLFKLKKISGIFRSFDQSLKQRFLNFFQSLSF